MSSDAAGDEPDEPDEPEAPAVAVALGPRGGVREGRGRRRRELTGALAVGALGGAGFGAALWLLGRLLGLA